MVALALRKAVKVPQFFRKGFWIYANRSIFSEPLTGLQPQAVPAVPKCLPVFTGHRIRLISLVRVSCYCLFFHCQCIRSQVHVLLKMETMKLSEFILLNEAQKKKTVLHQGVLVAKRSRGECLVFLFQLDNYYVEAYCNRGNG